MKKSTIPLVVLLLLGTACGPDAIFEDGASEDPFDTDDEVVNEITTRLKAPTLSKNGGTLSWQPVSAADGYNVYVNGTYLTTISTTSYVARQSGEYKVTSFDRDTTPITYSLSSNAVNVVVGATSPSAARPNAPVLSARGTRLEWPAVASATGYNVYLNGTYISTVNGLNFTANKSGDYTITSFNRNASPTTYSTESNVVKVIVSGTSPQSSNYEPVFYDDFEGSTLSQNFSNPWTSVPNRAVSFSAQPCSQSGGKLHLGFQKIGGKLVACYLSSNRTNFGPGDNATMKIEYRADVSGVRARGAWFAGWMYVTQGNGASDNNPATGMETDVFEYMPTYNSAYNVAAHDGASHEQWITPKSSFGVDLTQPGYHTYGVEWNKHCQVFTFDGRKVFTSTSPLSTAKVHSIMLTMEAQTQRQWDYWDVGNFETNLQRDGAVGKVDWVKVSQKTGADLSLCN